MKNEVTPYVSTSLNTCTWHRKPQKLESAHNAGYCCGGTLLCRQRCVLRLPQCPIPRTMLRQSHDQTNADRNKGAYRRAATAVPSSVKPNRVLDCQAKTWYGLTLLDTSRCHVALAGKLELSAARLPVCRLAHRDTKSV